MLLLNIPLAVILIPHNTYEGILFFDLKSCIISLQTDRHRPDMDEERGGRNKVQQV